MARWAVVKDSMRCHEGEIRLPERATECSGGYDFFSPCNVTILPHSKSLILTNTHGQDHGVVRTTQSE